MTVHTTKGFNSPKFEENRFDRIAETAQTCQDVHSQDVKQKEQLEHDAKNILDLSAPGVTGKDKRSEGLTRRDPSCLRSDKQRVRLRKCRGALK